MFVQFNTFCRASRKQSQGQYKPGAKSIKKNTHRYIPAQANGI